ncbi:MAG: leucine-rich repeat domain-containing protein [Clostridia bacterium]|nr:leucine-rich repeat domain-containing protein [Clostridia bacterium]
MTQFQHEDLSCIVLPDGTVEIAKYAGPEEPCWPPSTRDVIVPAHIGGRPVTSIGEEAFREAHVGRIMLPETLRRIGRHAFCACHFTQPLVIPDSVEEIGVHAFYRIGGEVQNPIPASLRHIAPGGYATSGVTGTLVLPETLRFVGSQAFAWNESLREIVLPACDFQAEEHAFMCVDRLAVHPGSAGEAIALATSINPHMIRRL